MFRSQRRPVVYPQAEHARLAGTIAANWRPDDVPLPFGSFVRGVTLHDRGYGELDDDPIGGTTPERWTEIETRGFRMRSGDDVTDLVVALHIRRLIGDEPEHPLAREIDDAIGDVPPEARAADRITEICDKLSFAYCSGEVDELVLDPWRLTVPELRVVIVGFEADGYPDRLQPVAEVVRVCAS